MPFRPWQKRLRALIVWGGLAAGSSAFCLLMLQALFGRQLEQLQTIQLGRELALNVRLTELALERYPPHLVAELTGLDLEVAVRPKPTAVPPSAGFKRQADALQQQLCQRLLSRRQPSWQQLCQRQANQAETQSECEAEWNQSENQQEK